MASGGERDMKAIAHGAVATARAKGASEVAVRAYRVRDVAVQWRDGKLEQINESTTRGVGLQLYVDGRYSAVSTSDLRPEALDVFIADVVPILQKRGLFRTAYQGDTLREHFGIPRPDIRFGSA